MKWFWFVHKKLNSPEIFVVSVYLYYIFKFMTKQKNWKERFSCLFSVRFYTEKKRLWRTMSEYFCQKSLHTINIQYQNINQVNYCQKTFARSILCHTFLSSNKFVITDWWAWLLLHLTQHERCCSCNDSKQDLSHLYHSSHMTLVVNVLGLS